MENHYALQNMSAHDKSRLSLISNFVRHQRQPTHQKTCTKSFVQPSYLTGGIKELRTIKDDLSKFEKKDNLSKISGTDIDNL
jgi:hypothetical protein